MNKKFLLVMVYGLLIVACGGPVGTVPTATTIPSPGPSSTLLADKDLETQTETSYSLDWSSDGETLAVSSGVEITLLSSDLSATIATLTPSNGALTAVWSPDQNNIATVSGFRNPMIAIWNWDNTSANLTMAQQIQAGSDQYGVSWSPDGRLLATLANDRKSIIQIWDTNTWTLLHKFDLPYANPRRALNWSTDSNKVYDAGELNGQVVYFGLNVDDGSVEELGKLPIEKVYTLTFSPDLKKVVVADESGQVQILEIDSGELLTEFQSVDAPVDLAWNPKNATLAVLGYETALQLWAIAP